MIRLIPRETKFFDLFAELSTSLNEGARLLRTILEDPHDLEQRVDQMQAIEHDGDRATHAIICKAQSDVYHAIRSRGYPSARVVAGRCSRFCECSRSPAGNVQDRKTERCGRGTGRHHRVASERIGARRLAPRKERRRAPTLR